MVRIWSAPRFGGALFFLFATALNLSAHAQLYHRKPDPALQGIIVNFGDDCSEQIRCEQEADKDSKSKHTNGRSDCGGLFYPDPTRSFSVFVFCDDAIGDTIAVVNSGRGSDAKKWSLEDSFWQESIWCRSVKNFAWSYDGRTLFVGTGDIYGDGNAFALNIEERTWKKLEIDVELEDSSKYCCSSTYIEMIEKDRVEVNMHIFGGEGEDAELNFTRSFDMSGNPLPSPSPTPTGTTP